MSTSIVTSSEVVSELDPRSVALVVASCDRYADVWQPWFQAFSRFWPDCPYSVYHVSDTLHWSAPSVRPLLTGPHYSWSDNLIKALSHLSETYVYLVVDDLIFTAPVDSNRVHALISQLHALDGNYLRLNDIPPYDAFCTADLGVINPGAVYRTSTQMCIWKRSTLLSILKSDESIWEFEMEGSRRSDAFPRFYATTRAGLEYVNAIIKGKWSRNVISRLAASQIEVPLGSRPVMSRREELAFRIGVVRNKCLYMLPSNVRRSIRERFGPKYRTI